MEELQSIKTELVNTLELIELFEEKKTKAASARVRTALGEVKKHVTSVRAALVAADKVGY